MARRSDPGATLGPARVLVVDDDESSRGALERLLAGDGFVTATACDGAAALVEARRVLPDVVITDLQMSAMNGVELCMQLHAIDPELPVIVMTGVSDMQTVIESLRAGAEDYLLKPLDYDAVLWCLRRAVGRRAAKLEQEAVYRRLNEQLVLSSLREQAHAEAERGHRAQLNELIANLSEGVIVADPGGALQMINAAARRILGVDDAVPDTVGALEARDFRHPAGRVLDAGARPIGRALRGEEFFDYAVALERAGGDRRHLLTTGTCVRDELGAVSLAIVVFRDVTELRRLEGQREEFLGLISHDLANPLSSVTMGVALLKRSIAVGRVTPGDVTVVERAERNVNRMRAMLAELTEATSFEAHGIALRRAPCALRAIVAGAVESMEDERAGRVSVEVDDCPDCVVLADATRLERVVANLLTNALKYSASDAPVTVRIGRDGAEVALAVSDRGIGIAPESAARLFERYYRTDTGKAHAGGLGLGLYISRMIVEAHGGRIEVASEVGVGSTFRLVLPAAPD
ncbi:MAG: Sensor protein [Myxococcaceae bacterium]|nr:Sensor protein [Myxococcaceae bacterium]